MVVGIAESQARMQIGTCIIRGRGGREIVCDNGLPVPRERGQTGFASKHIGWDGYAIQNHFLSNLRH